MDIRHDTANVEPICHVIDKSMWNEQTSNPCKHESIYYMKPWYSGSQVGGTVNWIGTTSITFYLVSQYTLFDNITKL